MPNEFIAKKGLISIGNSQVTGSLTVTSGIIGSHSGSTFGTSSWSVLSISASYAPGSPSASSSYATTASYSLNGGVAASPNKVTGSINFGFLTGKEDGSATSTISASWIANASIVEVKVTSESIHHSVEDSILEGLQFSVGNIIAGNSFDIYCYSINQTWGIYNITAVEIAN